jgi:hypothetical protein
MKKFQATNENAVIEPDYQPLSQETVRALQELGDVYRQIHRRLVSEGYVIKDGKIFPPESKNDGATQ